MFGLTEQWDHANDDARLGVSVHTRGTLSKPLALLWLLGATACGSRVVGLEGGVVGAAGAGGDAGQVATAGDSGGIGGDAGQDKLAGDSGSIGGDAGQDTYDAGADVEGGESNSCVSVTGGGPAPWLDLQIVGRQFDAYEGRHIRIVVANGVGGRLGVADAAIANGAFALTIPGTFNYSYYTEIALYVDDDADEACDVGEPLWGLVTGSVKENLLVEVTPDGACLSGGGPSMFNGCTAWRPPVGPCFINGQTDLKMRLPCPGDAGV